MEAGSEALLGGGKASGSARWCPYGAASAAGKMHVAIGLPAVILVTQALFAHSQMAPLWAAHGGIELRLMNKSPSSTESVMTYNLPHTVEELYRAEEYLLGKGGAGGRERG